MRSTGHPQPTVRGLGETKVPLVPDHLDSRILLGSRCKERGDRRIGAGIIDQQNATVGFRRIVRQGREQPFDMVKAIVDRNNDSDRGIRYPISRKRHGGEGGGGRLRGSDLRMEKLPDKSGSRRSRPKRPIRHDGPDTIPHGVNGQPPREPMLFVRPISARSLQGVFNRPERGGDIGHIQTSGGDSHYTDIVVVDYTVGFQLLEHGWANRLTRCHVWGGPIPPAKAGEPPEMLKDSVNFEIRVGGNILRDCYADTGKTGFLIAAETRLDGCSYFSNPVFKLDGITCIAHECGNLTVAHSSFTKTAPNVKIYDGCGEVSWRDCKTSGFEPGEIPFGAAGAAKDAQRLA